MGTRSSRELGNRDTTVMHHKVDMDHADSLDRAAEEGHGDTDGEEYITDGPHSASIHQGLAKLGWRHNTKHAMYHEDGRGTTIRTESYEHPNGSTMTHLAHHTEDDSNHYWHVR